MQRWRIEPFLCLLALSCGSKSVSTKTTVVGGIGDSDDLTIPRVDPSLCDTESKKVVTSDLNKDNKPDVWKLYAQINEGGTEIEVLTCRQVDFDRDGKKDFVVTFTKTGEVLAEEFDFDFDGHFDARRHFDKKTGKVYLVERDSDFDQKPDVWEKFDDVGNPESVRRDRNADGKPDYWEQYKSGVLIAILYDDDFDNRIDRRDEQAAKAPATSVSGSGDSGDSGDGDSGDGDSGDSGDGDSGDSGDGADPGGE